MTHTPSNKSKLEDAIVRYVATQGSSRLRGRFFDVGSDEGRREYAQWLAGEITELDKFVTEESQ